METLRRATTSLLLSWLVIAYVGCASNQGAAKSGGRAASARGASQTGPRVELPSYGLSVPVPNGYVRDADGTTTAVIFVPAGKLGTSPGRFVMVDLLPKGQLTLKQEANRIAYAEGMEVASEAADWGGRPAVELVATNPKDGKAMATWRAMFVESDGYIYRLGFAADAQHAQDLSAYQAVASGTRWVPVQPAGRGVAARRPSLSLPTGIAVSIPDPFRPDMTSKAKFVSTFLAFNLPSGRPVARLLIIPFADRDTSRSLASLQADVGRELVPQWKLKEPLRWKDERGPVATSLAAPADGADQRVEVLIALLPDGRATVFSLQYDRGDATEGMERALDLLKASIRPDPRR